MSNESHALAPSGWFALADDPYDEETAPLARRARHMNERVRQLLGHTNFERLYLADLELVLLRHGEHCFYCGCDLSFSEIPFNGTFDHVQPVSRGGRNVWQNVVPSCEPCNVKKTDRRIVYRGGRVRMLWPDQEKGSH